MSAGYWPISPVLNLPLEIHDLIASHLPAQVRPAVLLSFALTNSRLHHLLLPILYTKVIIKNEEMALAALQSVLDHKEFSVRELRILIGVKKTTPTSGEQRKRQILLKLHEIIKAGRLPHMHTFELTFLCTVGSIPIEDYNMFVINQKKYLSDLFWEDLRNNCPQIRSLFLHGITSVKGNPWIENLALPKSKRLRNLSIKFAPTYPDQECVLKILESLRSIASALTTLTLCLSSMQLDAKPVLLLTFPHLKSLELGSFYLSKSKADHDNSIRFWERHPGLERLILGGQWFTKDMNIKPGLFPNLSYLKVTDYSDARAMTSILPQLKFLSIKNSVNGQIPYLLRSVLPRGLPKLKSLEINQTPYCSHDVRELEGAMWYETVSGEFREASLIRKASRSMTDCYMHSIVRGAPNVEELCLQGFPLTSSHLRVLSLVLSRLQHLKRLYYRAYPRRTQRDANVFAAGCRYLAEQCPLLDTVTDLGPIDLPYPKVSVIRNHTGAVEKVVPGVGFGMYFMGSDDDPFPKNSPN